MFCLFRCAKILKFFHFCSLILAKHVAVPAYEGKNCKDDISRGSAGNSGARKSVCLLENNLTLTRRKVVKNEYLKSLSLAKCAFRIIIGAPIQPSNRYLKQAKQDKISLIQNSWKQCKFPPSFGLRDNPFL